MGSPVLVGFATRYGSTKEVAEAVAAALRGAGVEVEVKPLREVGDPRAYHGVVIGAPLQMFRWHKDALGFIANQRQSLERKPVAVFALGPVTGEEKEFVEARSQLDKELAQFPWFLPFEVKIFGGKFDPLALRFPWTWLPAVKKWPAMDIRDWQAVSSWAQGLAARFLAGES